MYSKIIFVKQKYLGNNRKQEAIKYLGVYECNLYKYTRVIYFPLKMSSNEAAYSPKFKLNLSTNVGGKN